MIVCEILRITLRIKIASVYQRPDNDQRSTLNPSITIKKCGPRWHHRCTLLFFCFCEINFTFQQSCCLLGLSQDFFCVWFAVEVFGKLCFVTTLALASFTAKLMLLSRHFLPSVSSLFPKFSQFSPRGIQARTAFGPSGATNALIFCLFFIPDQELSARTSA